MLGSMLWLCLSLVGVGEEVDRTAAAKAALSHASGVRRSSHGKEGEAKYTLLRDAATAYEQVASDFEDVPTAAGEAWFRAGEIFRILRNVELAAVRFEKAAAIAEAPTFGARALNELGHLYRRTRDYERALSFYRNVAEKFPAERREAARAQTWQGKVHVLQEKFEEGHRLLLEVYRLFPEFPVEDIRNVDTVATAWIKDGRSEEARRLVQDCLERHSLPTEGEEEVAKDVSTALERMRARELLDQQNPSEENPATTGS
jgi:tetratricopeptide (TPR) repeat protein